MLLELYKKKNYNEKNMVKHEWTQYKSLNLEPPPPKKKINQKPFKHQSCTK